MSFRSWLYVFAIIGLALTGSLQAQQQDAEADQEASDEQTPTNQLPFTLPVIVIESDEAAEARRSEESERTQREKDDLVAQQGMNAATQAMNQATQSMKRASWVSTFLVGLGTFLLVWTLNLTRSANTSSRKMVEGQRPWICLDDLEITHGVNPTHKGKLHRISSEFFPVWINSGQSPALLSGFEIGHVLIETDAPPPDDIATRSGPIGNYGIMGSAQKRRGANIVLIDDERDRFFSGKCDMFFVSVCRYRDTITSEDRMTSVQIRLRVIAEGRDGNGNPLFHYQNEAVGPRNSAT